MTSRTATRVMKARRPGECPRCGRYIRVGDQIALCGIWLCIRCVLAHLDDHKREDDDR